MVIENKRERETPREEMCGVTQAIETSLALVIVAI